MHNSTALNKSLVFIDSQVANADKPNESVAPGVEEMFFDATKDQVTPITEAPTQYTDVSSIHLVSHGQAVSFLLEPTQLKQ